MKLYEYIKYDKNGLQYPPRFIDLKKLISYVKDNYDVKDDVDDVFRKCMTECGGRVNPSELLREVKKEQNI